MNERERPPGLPLDPYYVIPKSDRVGLTTEQIAEALGITATEVEDREPPGRAALAREAGAGVPPDCGGITRATTTTTLTIN